MVTCRRGLREPLANDRDGFVRVLLGKLADAMDRLGVHLALHLRHVDQFCACCSL